MKTSTKKKRYSKKKPADIIFDIGVYAIAIIMILLVLYPLWFILIASFSDPGAVARGDIWLWPKNLNFDGYRELFKQDVIWIGYRNTIIYTIVGTFISLAVNLSAGYALSRDDLFGRKWLQIIYMVPMFIGGGLIPTYLVIRDLGLLDSFWVLVLPFSVSSYNIIVARTFFKTSLPEGLWEAAQIDGVGTLRYFFSFVIPLSKAIIAVLGLWTAVGIWNSWFDALIYLRNPNLQPLQLVLRRILIANESLLGQALSLIHI